ncbi:hypothetical protein ACC785_38875, partial [Rhizobium ruizarguesonis]
CLADIRLVDTRRTGGGDGDVRSRQNLHEQFLAPLRRAICSLAIPASYVLTDGLDVPPGLDCPGQAVVKGDARSVSIA